MPTGGGHGKTPPCEGYLFAAGAATVLLTRNSLDADFRDILT
jgi:hypothetical protein